jgi:hypothetical protein
MNITEHREGSYSYGAIISKLGYEGGSTPNITVTTSQIESLKWETASRFTDDQSRIFGPIIFRVDFSKDPEVLERRVLSNHNRIVARSKELMR